MMHRTRKLLFSPRQRQRKIDRVFRHLAECILLCYFVFVVGVLVSTHPYVQITRVSIEGTRAVDVATIAGVIRNVLEQKVLGKIARNNIFFLPRSELLAAVKKVDRRIASVAIATPSPKELVMMINEYTPTLLWCPSRGDNVERSIADAKRQSLDFSSCYFADKNGYIFDRAPQFSGTILRVYRTPLLTPLSDEPIGQYLLPGDTLRLLERMVVELESIGIVVYAIDALGSGDYRFMVNAPWMLLWSETKDPRASVENLALFLRQLGKDNEIGVELSSIDLRFGDKIFYKTKE